MTPAIGKRREPLVNPAASTHNGRRFDVEETAMKLLNRSALSVRPTQHFVDWINGLEPTLGDDDLALAEGGDRKSTRLNSSHVRISYAVFCLKKKKKKNQKKTKKINKKHTK